VLARDFVAEAPNRKWVTDITYLWTANGWVYLAVVVDLFSRKVVGWSLSESLATDLVADALRQAIETRRPVGEQLLHHSDRGCQYTSDTYRGILRTMNIECSMSRTGSCYDNAVAERFFWSLKQNGPTTPCCQTSKPPDGASSSTSPRSTILSGSTIPSTTSRPNSSKPITPRLLWCETPPRSPEVGAIVKSCVQGV
jgi:transposase InsO family protein